MLPDQCVDDLGDLSKIGYKIINEIEDKIKVLADLPKLIKAIKAS